MSSMPTTNFATFGSFTSNRREVSRRDCWRRTGKPLAAATIKARLAYLKAFFEWLAQEPGYRRAIKVADAAYFNPTDNLARVASARRFKPFPTLAQIETVLRAMPDKTEIERRDRAVVAFTILTCARVRAIVSIR